MIKVWIPFLLLLFVVGCSSPQQDEQVEQRLDEHYDPILTPYFEIVEALTNDDFEAVRSLGEELSKAEAETGVKLALTRMGTLISQASSTFDQRAVLKQLGMVIPLYIEESVINTYPIFKYKCKNEFDGKEVYWLSFKKGQGNPYIGNNSTDCIELIETIKPVKLTKK